MIKNRFGRIWPACAILILASLACISISPAKETPAPTSTSAPTSPPTATVLPTATTIPTPTPNATATQEVLDLQKQIQGYVSSGYLPSANGTLYSLKDNSLDLAQRNFLDFFDSGYKDTVKDFAAWGDVNWSTDGPVSMPAYSGCGFSFHFKGNGDAYTALLTNDRVLLTWCFSGLGNRCGAIGKTRGAGRLGYSSPAKAHFELIVNDIHAYVLVDGQFTGEYTLFDDKLTNPGYFVYTIVSGTNHGYGTHCEIANAQLWVPK